MIPGPPSLSEGQKADEALLKYQVRSRLVLQLQKADQGHMGGVDCEINFCSM